MDGKDRRWEPLLDEVEKLRGKPVKANNEKDWEAQLALGPIEQFKKQLNCYLLKYTKGSAHAVVEAGDVRGVLDVWRQMADKGHSQRDAHIMTLREKAYNPRKAVQPKDLEIAIALWEKDVAYFSRATGERISEPNVKLMLINMCPERLRYHLKLRSDRLTDYDDIKTEIVEWLAEEIKPISRGTLKVASQQVPQEQQGDGTGGEQEEDLDEGLIKQLNEADSSGHLYALVRNAMLKQSKGDVKCGKGKGKGRRKCFECDSENHIASACPVRAERVANGGPARLDKPDVDMKGDKGKGKGGKGKGKFQLTKIIWRGWNPGKGAQLPLTGPQWMNWMPPQTPQAKSFSYPGGEFQQMFTPGFQLNSITTRKSPSLPARVPISLENKFSALSASAEEDDIDEDETQVTWPSIPAHFQRKKAPKMPRFIKSSCKDSSCGGMGACEERHGRRLDCGVYGVPSEVLPSETPRSQHLTKAQQKLSVFSEKKPMSLKPLSEANEWEYIETILDSGATVTVIPPHVGHAYEIRPSAASKAGVKYEVANGDEIPNLGEKLMPVMTREGSMRGLRAQVADVSKALQSVRALVKAGHMVIFGDGDEGQSHYVYNKFTGETNEVTDDGINYLMGMYIVPPDEAGFGRPAE